jgi:hypothetical protein
MASCESCECCVPCETVPVLVEPCAAESLYYGRLYNLNLQLGSGSCVSGVWGLAPPPSTVDPDVPAPVRYDAETSSSTVTFKKSGDLPNAGPIAPEDDVLIVIGGRQVLYNVPLPMYAYNLLQLVWSADAGVVVDDVSARFRVQSCVTGTSADADDARTCIVTQILPVYVPPLSPTPPVSDLADTTFVPLVIAACVITLDPGTEVLIPAHSVVFSKFKQLADLASITSPPFPSGAYVAVLWQLTVHTLAL